MIDDADKHVNSLSEIGVYLNDSYVVYVDIDNSGESISIENFNELKVFDSRSRGRHYYVCPMLSDDHLQLELSSTVRKINKWEIAKTIWREVMFTDLDAHSTYTSQDFPSDSDE